MCCFAGCGSTNAKPRHGLRKRTLRSRSHTEMTRVPQWLGASKARRGGSLASCTRPYLKQPNRLNLSRSPPLPQRCGGYVLLLIVYHRLRRYEPLATVVLFSAADACAADAFIHECICSNIPKSRSAARSYHSRTKGGSIHKFQVPHQPPPPSPPPSLCLS